MMTWECCLCTTPKLGFMNNCRSDILAQKHLLYLNAALIGRAVQQQDFYRHCLWSFGFLWRSGHPTGCFLGRIIRVSVLVWHLWIVILNLSDKKICFFRKSAYRLQTKMSLKSCVQRKCTEGCFTSEFSVKRSIILKHDVLMDFKL